MNETGNCLPTVLELRNAIDSTSDNYILGYQSKEISHKLSFKNQQDIKYMIIGLWYLFVIENLPSTTKSIWAYEDKQIQLSDFIIGKMTVIKTWRKDWLFNDFNDFILDILKYEDLKTYLEIEGTLIMSSFRGRNWIEHLNNDEYQLKLENNIHQINDDLKCVELELYNQLIENDNLQSKIAQDAYHNLIQLVESEPQKYDLLLFRYEEIAFREAGCKFRNGKINKAAVYDFIHRLTGVNERTIEKRLDRHLMKKGLLRFKVKNNLKTDT